MGRVVVTCTPTKGFDPDAAAALCSTRIL
jgi:hypothetical protein